MLPPYGKKAKKLLSKENFISEAVACGHNKLA